MALAFDNPVMILPIPVVIPPVAFKTGPAAIAIPLAVMIAF